METVKNRHMRAYLSVIIPAYNEEKVIADNINQVAEYLFRTLGRDKPFEILVINDGSSDSTAQVLSDMAAERNYLVVRHHSRNMGRGRALRTGFEHATGAFVFTLDADLSYTPEHIGRMLSPLERDEADIVLASAYHPDGSVINVPFKRTLVSRLGNRILAAAVGGGLHTLTCVVRGYKRGVLDNLELFNDGKELHLEIIQKARMQGYRIAEIPAELAWRNAKRTTGKKNLSSGHFTSLVSEHLFFNFLLRPSMLLWLPLLALLLILLASTVMIVIGYTNALTSHPSDSINLYILYTVLREHMLFAKITYFIWGFTLFLIFQFLSLTFITKQNAHYYRELFLHFARLNHRVKNIESKDNR